MMIMTHYYDKKYGGAAVSFSSVLMIIFSLLLHYQLSQNMTLEEYGDIAIGLNISVILITLVQFGIPGYWLRYFARWGYEAYSVLFPSKKLIAITSVIPILLVIVALLDLPQIGLPQKTSHALIMLIAPIAAVTEIGLVSLQLEGRFVLFSLLRITVSALRCIIIFLILILIHDNLSPIASAISIFTASLIGFLFLIPQLKRVFQKKLILQGHSVHSKSIVNKISLNMLTKYCAPYAFLGILYLAWQQGHVVISGIFLGPDAAGTYNLAILVTTSVSLIPSVLFSKYYLPMIHRMVANDLNALKQFLFKSIIVLFCLGLFTTVFIYISIDTIASFFLSTEYKDVPYLVKLIVLTLPVRFAGYAIGSVLTTEELVMFKLKTLFILTILNFLGVIIFSQDYGISAFATSIVLTEFVLILVYSIKTWEFLQKN